MKLKYTIIGLLGLFMFSGCSDFLDVTPKDQQTEEQLYATRGGFFTAVNGIYNSLGGSSLYGKYLSYEFIDVIAKRYAPSASNTYLTALNTWDYTNSDVENALSNIWSSAYSTILGCNVIIDNVDRQSGVLSESDANLIRGEMLAVRAFLHFDMLRLFGPIYVSNPSAQAIPYNESVRISALDFLPADTVVNRILRDLNSAENLLANDPVIQGGPLTSVNSEEGDDVYLSYRQLRMNYYAVKALKARVYLYSGDKANALAMATSLLNDPVLEEHFPAVDPSKLLANQINPDRVFSTETLMGLYYDSMSDLYAYSFDGDNAGTYLLSPRVNYVDGSLFSGETQDYRFQSQWNVSSTVGVDGYVFVKYKPIEDEDEEYFWSRFLPLIRLSEMYYIAAECEPNINDGVAWLNQARERRGLAQLEVSADNLMSELKKEYLREFWGEGQIFFMFKRLNSDIEAANNGHLNSLVKNTKIGYVPPMPAGELENR